MAGGRFCLAIVSAVLLASVAFAGSAGAQSGVASLQVAQLMLSQSQPAPGLPSATPPNAATAAPDPNIPRPPGLVPLPPASAATAAPPAPAMVLPAPAAVAPPAAPASLIPPGLGAIAATARFGKDAPSIISGLHWRVYGDRPDQTGAFKLMKEDKGATPIFILPPGGYVVHVAFGLATVTKRVTVRNETIRESFEIPAGGARFEGRVADARIPVGQISFDVFKGGQFEVGDKRPLASEVVTADLVLLPEGTYHVVSNYGDGNSVIRSDFRVQAGKLTDARINHRAALITLKLVSDKGGEALANTAWSVLTPGGDVIKESIGAFPTVVLAEGDYVAIARNEGKVYNREFKVEPGFDREIELLAR